MAGLSEAGGEAGAVSRDRHFISTILDPSADWELVSQGYKYTEGPGGGPRGKVFFSDVDAKPIEDLQDRAWTEKVSLFKADSGGANGLMFGPDGRLYAAQRRPQADRRLRHGRDGEQ